MPKVLEDFSNIFVKSVRDEKKLTTQNKRINS